MSSRHNLQDATGDVLRHPTQGVLWIVLPRAPVNTTDAAAPGCIWQNPTGAAGLRVYVNEGTFAASVWVAIG